MRGNWRPRAREAQCARSSRRCASAGRVERAEQAEDKRSFECEERKTRGASERSLNNVNEAASVACVTVPASRRERNCIEKAAGAIKVEGSSGLTSESIRQSAEASVDARPPPYEVLHTQRILSSGLRETSISLSNDGQQRRGKSAPIETSLAVHVLQDDWMVVSQRQRAEAQGHSLDDSAVLAACSQRKCRPRAPCPAQRRDQRTVLIEKRNTTEFLTHLRCAEPAEAHQCRDVLLIDLSRIVRRDHTRLFPLPCALLFPLVLVVVPPTVARSRRRRARPGRTTSGRRARVASSSRRRTGRRASVAAPRAWWRRARSVAACTHARESETFSEPGRTECRIRGCTRRTTIPSAVIVVVVVRPGPATTPAVPVPPDWTPAPPPFVASSAVPSAPVPLVVTVVASSSTPVVPVVPAASSRAVAVAVARRCRA